MPTRSHSEKTGTASGFGLAPGATVREILAQVAAFLEAGRIEEPRLIGECVVSQALACPRLALHVRPDEKPGMDRLTVIARAARRLAGGEPLQYVLGQTEFRGRVFKADPRALIPRPETEILVDWVLQFQPLWHIPHPIITEVGTGSGCIVISLALERPQGKYSATDIGAAALELARENAAALARHASRVGTLDRIRFTQADLLGDMSAGALDAVVANPPYVRTADWRRLPRQIRDHEPRLALDGGTDGLKLIRRLIKQAFQALGPAGGLFLEMGEDQQTQIEKLARQAGFQRIEFGRDLAGKLRLARAEKT